MRKVATFWKEATKCSLRYLPASGLARAFTRSASALFQVKRGSSKLPERCSTKSSFSCFLANLAASAGVSTNCTEVPKLPQVSGGDWSGGRGGGAKNGRGSPELARGGGGRLVGRPGHGVGGGRSSQEQDQGTRQHSCEQARSGHGVSSRTWDTAGRSSSQQRERPGPH